MDTLLQTHFQRVETALGSLVDSIASYNPSPQAALDLVAADDDLSRGLDQLARHQANHGRILALRSEAEALEAQLKSSVTTLADLRHELFETPATAVSENSRPVPFDELLQYAKNISKHTVPPTYREPIPKEEAKADREREGTSPEGPSSNGLGTPALPGVIATAAATVAESSKEKVEGDGEGTKEVTAEEEEWLRKLRASDVQWYPWPSDDKIRRGNLMAIQHLLDQGQRPEAINIAEVAEEEAKAEEQRKAALQAPQEPQMQVDVIEHAAPLSAGPRPPREQPAVYAGFEDFEEEDL